MLRYLALLFTIAAPSVLLAQNDTTGNDTAPDAIKPIASWHFEGADSLGEWTGKAKPNEVGPRAPTYPNFAKDNKAGRFTGDGTKLALKVKDNEDLRFGLNDSITLEAWVKVSELSDGATPYIIGKGRLGTKEFGAQNQNYALRIKGEKGQALVGFLFASEAANGKKSEWHRWWTKEGFSATSGWHHIAVSFTFGKPKSIKAFIDNSAITEGVWDMGGATDRAPVQDGDAVMLGTGSTLAPSHSLKGWLDDVAIYRSAVSDDIMLAKYHFVPPPPPIVAKDVPAGHLVFGRVKEQVSLSGRGAQKVRANKKARAARKGKEKS